MAERKRREETPEYKAMRDLANEQLLSGKSLTGEGGVFAPMLKEFLDSALGWEMGSHLERLGSVLAAISANPHRGQFTFPSTVFSISRGPI
jgi:hypothetical protein